MKTAATLKPSPFVGSVKAYTRSQHPVPVDLLLDGNEGSRPPDSLLRDLVSAGPDLLRLYPDKSALERKLASMHGVEPDRVIITAGADDGIERAMRSVLAPGCEMVLPVPTFVMFERYAALNGARIVEVPWIEGNYPVDAVIDAVTRRTALIVVVTPNNPTGLAATAVDLGQLSHEAPGALLLVDLAYTEFADEDLFGCVLGLPNAVALRTLSKAWGLAGLRVGYAVGPPEVIGWMHAAGQPYAVTAPSLRIAETRLDGGGGEVARFVARVRDERARLAARLNDLGVEALASQANFILVRPTDGEWLRDGLAGHGIAVRTFPGSRHLENCVRITLPGEENNFERLLQALATVAAPEALLFDLDDTLFDTTDSYRRTIIATAELFGIAVSNDDITEAKAAGDANNDWKLTWRLVSEQGVEVSFDEITERFETLYQGSDGKPGFRSKEKLLVDRGFLERLARRFRLGIVTGRPRGDAMRSLDDQGIASLFDAVITMDDGPLKPSPEPVRAAMERLGVTRAWMIGDTPDDIRAARSAGALPVGVVAPSDDPAVARDAMLTAGASRVLDATDELEELLK